MPEPKKPSSQAAEPEVDEPGSRVRVKPQPMDRGAMRRVVANALSELSADSMRELIAEAETNHWSREQMADRVIELSLETAGALLSDEDRAELARKVRELVLNDPRFAK